MSVLRRQAGNYQIQFSSPITHCAFSATPAYFGDPAVTPEPDIVGVTAAVQPQGDKMLVVIMSRGGNREDHGFELIEKCGP
jgi:hypothetical protein